MPKTKKRIKNPGKKVGEGKIEESKKTKITNERISKATVQGFKNWKNNKPKEWEQWKKNLKKSKIKEDDTLLKKTRIMLDISQREMTFMLSEMGEGWKQPKGMLPRPAKIKRISHNAYARIEQRIAFVTKERAGNILKILNKKAKKMYGTDNKYILSDLFFIPAKIAEKVEKKPSAKLKFMAR